MADDVTTLEQLHLELSEPPMNDPAVWLERVAPGFVQLSGQEREAIKDFALLWSFYEGMILHTVGSANAIVRTVGSLKKSGRLSLEPFRPAIKYFTERYFDETDLTYAFSELHWRRNDQTSLVERVVRGQTLDDAEILSAVLIIVLRLRNNLFHGVKWSYGIKGQLENFRNANNVLMSVIDLHQGRVGERI